VILQNNDVFPSLTLLLAPVAAKSICLAICPAGRCDPLCLYCNA